MPGTAGDSDRQLAAAVRAGVIDEALVDERVDEILEFALRTDAARKAPARSSWTWRPTTR